MASYIELSNLRLNLSKNHLLWFCTSVLVPLAVIVVAEQSVERSPVDSTEIPSSLGQYAIYAEFKKPPLKCFQLKRWPNTYAYCDFLSRAADADVLTFYQQELARHGWLQQNNGAHGWKSYAENGVVIGVFSREDFYFLLEKFEMNTVTDNRTTYRLLVTTLLRNLDDIKKSKN